MKLATATIISNKKVMPDTHLLWLESADIAKEARPGQFVMVRCGEGFELMLRRPISIHQVSDNKLTLLYRIVGKGTTWLSERQADEPLDLTGPFGNGFNIRPTSRNLLLVAGGIGIAPIVFLAREAIESGYLVTLLYGAKTEHELYPEQLLPDGLVLKASAREFSPRARPEGIRASAKVISATDDGSAGRQGMVTAFLPEYIDSADQVFACGPVAMYRYMALKKQELLKDKPCQISLEMRMGCGHGVCYSCTIRTKQGLKQVCKDGPVFELDDVIMDELIC